MEERDHASRNTDKHASPSGPGCKAAIMKSNVPGFRAAGSLCCLSQVSGLRSQRRGNGVGEPGGISNRKLDSVEKLDKKSSPCSVPGVWRRQHVDTTHTHAQRSEPMKEFKHVADNLKREMSHSNSPALTHPARAAPEVER
ncbi:hypothetical protein EYF80_017684 [Liparis tanakae]|uniref:Uncharacterized protein n=1 Tax=Liparis tanakae TaxID=230148 RepID=A0A4Z2I287_9TELE|nr:hypothetical protein EYF80_017684 [Liparis tanakae]